MLSRLSLHLGQRESRLLYLKKFLTIIPIVLLIFSVVLVRKLLNEYTFSEVLADLSSIPKLNLFFAFLLSILNYFVLALYDYLGVRYVKEKIATKKIALVSFMAYAFSQNLGASILSGGAIRYRFYQKEGLKGATIAKLIAFNAIHFWLGLFLISGFIAILSPESFLFSLRFSTSIIQLIGIILIAPVSLYVFFLTFPKLVTRKYRRLLPKRNVGLCGLLVCILDWILAASVFYCTLIGEHEITIFKTIAAFIAAQLAGVLSHVPGGLGVFEATVGYLLSPHQDNSALVSSLIAFRIIYYLIPFVIAILFLTAYEILAQKTKVFKNQKILANIEFFENLFTSTAPVLSSFLTVSSGIFLLFSNTTPALFTIQLRVKTGLLSYLFDTSYFLSGVFGVGLVIVGIGLRRKLKSAWNISFVFLCVSLPFALLKGHSTEFLILGSNICFLLYTRRSFSRENKNNFPIGFSAWKWALGVVVVTIVFGIFAYQDYEYSSKLWFDFSINYELSYFLHSVLGMLIGLIVSAAYFVLVKQSAIKPRIPDEVDFADIKRLLPGISNTMVFLSFLKDKEILFSDDRNAFLMWGYAGNSIVCLSDPFGLRSSFAELFWKFREIAERNSKICAFYEISSDTIPYVLDLGMTLYKIGEEGEVLLKDFSLIGPKASPFRNIINKMEKENFSFRVLEIGEVKERMHELKLISENWLSHKNASEKGFSLGFFDTEYLSYFRSAVVEKDNKIYAFSNILELENKSQLSIDLMRHLIDSPNGVMDYLFINLLKWGKGAGYQTFSLGMAPLSGLSTNTLAPNYAKFGNLIFRHGGHFYNFGGLRKYKEKFRPEWSPRYIACPSGIYLPVVLSNVSKLVSRGLKGVLKEESDQQEF